MDKQYLLIDIDRCYGCKTCQTACKMEHGYCAGSPSCIEVVRVERIDNNGKLQCDFAPAVCLHCSEPDCLNACPVGAITRDENNFVRINRDECVGCGSCEAACRYGAIALSEYGNAVAAYKCDLCAERRARGLEPSCVQHCLGQALTLCSETQLDEKLKNRNHWSSGSVVYVSSKISRLFADEDMTGETDE